MTTPGEDQPPAPTPAPTVSTAPPRSRWGWSRVPAHVGPARTSTVIIALLFAGVFALWLVVRPETATVTTTGSTGGAQPTQVQHTAPRTTTPAPRTTTTPARSSAVTSSAASSTQGTTSSTESGSSGTSSGTGGSPTTTPLLPTTGSAPSS